MKKATPTQRIKAPRKKRAVAPVVVAVTKRAPHVGMSPSSTRMPFSRYVE